MNARRGSLEIPAGIIPKISPVILSGIPPGNPLEVTPVNRTVFFKDICIHGLLPRFFTNSRYNPSSCSKKIPLEIALEIPGLPAKISL